jgi:hypothetical protein
MDMKKFIEAVKSKPSCASCVFFEKAETWKTRGNVNSANFHSRSTAGRCMRFPPVIIKKQKGNKEAIFDQPDIRVIVSEDTIEDEHGRLPWCGEHKPTDLLNYIDCEEWRN